LYGSSVAAYHDVHLHTRNKLPTTVYNVNMSISTILTVTAHSHTLATIG
jgi:hypothetical protein